MDTRTPGCYYDAASSIKDNRITQLEFFQQCLAHLGPEDTRSRHPEDEGPIRDLLNPLFWRGAFGPVAAAIKLCESDPQALSIDVACTSTNETIDSVKSIAASSLESQSQAILESPLFRQALVTTAIRSNHPSLARDLVRESPSQPPPPDQCVFSVRYSSLVDDEDIPSGVWAALVAAEWARPSHTLASLAVTSGNGADGVALLDALRAAGFDFHGNPVYRQMLPDLALACGVPEVLRHVWDLYSDSDPAAAAPPPRLHNDMLTIAVEARPAGGVEMLRWLLSHGLDVNYVRDPADTTRPSFVRDPGDEDRPGHVNDPREAAEQWYGRQQSRISSRKTALHAAAWKGNAEAVEFLLQHGALANSEDGFGQTARQIAERNGHERVVQLLDSHIG